MKGQVSLNTFTLHGLEDLTLDAIILQKLEILSNLSIGLTCYICGVKGLPLEPLL